MSVCRAGGADRTGFFAAPGKEEAERIAGESLSFWRDVFRRLRKNPVAMGALVFLLVMTALRSWRPS
ncbi:hypothetical protein [Hydrogenibacillus schlegelii]|uniref:hypothetical protein n=1 Tax=Hydrogenibacillus schlegelii TaxID=1484 RepID=UPI00349FE7E8